MAESNQTETLPESASRGDRLALAVGLLLLTALFVPTLAFGQSLSCGDMATFTVPQFQYISEHLRALRVPAWNPYMGYGQPNIGDSSVPFFYPLNVLHFLFSPLTTLHLFLFLHLYLLFLGSYVFLRDWQCSPQAGFLGSLSLMLGGVAVSHFMVPMYCFGMAWLPWNALLFLRLLKAPSARRLGLCGLSFAMIVLSGAVEFCPLSAVMALVLAVALSPRPLWQVLLAMFAVTLLTASLTALAVLPSLINMPTTMRAEPLPRSWSLRWSMSALEGLGLFVPRAFAQERLNPEWIQGPSYDVFGEPAMRPWFISLHCGFWPLCLALWVLFTRFFEDSKVRALALIIVLFTPLALGGSTPIYPSLQAFVPGLAKARYPAKFYVPVALALSWLAALGWDALQAEGSPKTLWGPVPALILALVLTLTVALGVLGLLSSGFVGLPEALTSLRNIRVSLAQATLTGGLLLALLWRWPEDSQPWALLTLTAIDLLLLAAACLVFAPRAMVEQEPRFVSVLRDQQRRQPTMLVSVKNLESASVQVLGNDKMSSQAMQQLLQHQMLALNAGLPYKVRNIQAFSAFRSRRFHKLWLVMQRRDLSSLERGQIQSANFFTMTPEQDPGSVSQLTMIDQYGPFWLARSQRPRAWLEWLPSAERVPDTERAITRLIERGAAHKPVFIESEEPLQFPNQSVLSPVKIECRQYTSDEFELRIECQRAGYLLMRESFHPSWRATLDGQEVPIYAADVLFRAIPIGAGAHVLKAQYQARGWRLGLVISALAWLVCGGLVLGPSLGRTIASGQSATA